MDTILFEPGVHNGEHANPNMPDACPAMTVAMLYVPVQHWETPYDEDTALERGTVFPSLDKPFTGEGRMRRE